MLEKNNLYKITIDSITNEGSGVGRIDGMAVFVPGTCIGDHAMVRIVKCKASYAYARLEQLLAPSPDRVEPYCPAASACGGCTLAHMRYPAQLTVKRQIVQDALKKIGAFPIAEQPEQEGLFVRPVLGMEHPLAYRNKMIFPIGTDSAGQPVGGFYQSRSHRIIPLSGCPIGELFASACMRAVVEYMRENGVAAYDEASHHGLVRRVMVRTGLHTREGMVVLSVNGDQLPHTDRLIQKLLTVSGNYQLISIILNHNKTRTNAVLGETNTTLYGADVIHDRLCGLDFAISPNSFYQVNPLQTQVLYQTALRFAGLTGNETVVELYSGIGTISLCAAQQARRVIAVEVVADAVRDARQNAASNGVRNAEFMQGDAAQLASKLAEQGIRPDVVIIDPPRKGSATQTLNAIIKMQPKRLVYVSCNPATLARDARYLADTGSLYPTAVQPVDMFPGTGHVETVVLMSKKDK